MLFILSLIIGTPARLLTQPHADDATKDLEILMRRQQLRVLPGTASRVVPKDRWSSFLVTPAAAAALAPRTRPTHVDRPQGAHPRGRPPIDAAVTALVLRRVRGDMVTLKVIRQTRRR